MKTFLNQYGKAIFGIIIVTFLVFFATPVGKTIKSSITGQLQKTNEIGTDKIEETATGKKLRPKEPATAVD